MTEITSISAAIASVKNAFDIAKTLKAADKTFEKAETRLEMSKLMDALFEARERVLEASELLREKDEKIRSLEERLKIKESLSFRDNSYWIEKESGQDGAFCTQCWDMDGKLVRKIYQEKEEHWYCVTHGHPMHRLSFA